MMKSARVVPLLISAIALCASSAAMAGGVSLGVNIGIPAPVYVEPAPVYAPPPPPVYYAPPPAVVYAPGPAIIIGWHDDRYWDGRRWWGRDEWSHHHHDDHGGWHGDHDGGWRGDRDGDHHWH